MGDLIQFRPWKEKRDAERIEQQISDLTGIPYGGAGIDGMSFPGVDTHYHQMYQAPVDDPA